MQPKIGIYQEPGSYRGLESCLLHFHWSIFGNCSHCSAFWSFCILSCHPLEEVAPLNLHREDWHRKSKNMANFVRSFF